MDTAQNTEAVDTSDGPVDVEYLKTCRRRLVLHMSLARGGSHYAYECVEYPRLKIMQGREIGRHPWARTMTVDGLEVANLAEAVDALNRSREENERMAEERTAAKAPAKRWRLDDGIAELEREQQHRGRTQPQLIGRGALTEAEANENNRALEGTLTFLRFCKKYEHALREFMSQAKAHFDEAGTKQTPDQGEML